MQREVLRQAYKVIKIIGMQSVTSMTWIIESDIRIFQICKVLHYITDLCPHTQK